MIENKNMKYLGYPDLHHLERLITFSSLDLNSSSIGFLSDDDDNEDPNEAETGYIEIALDHEPLAEPAQLPGQLCDEQGEGEGEPNEKSSTSTGDPPDNQELEFGTSFCTLVSTFPGFPSSSTILSSSTIINTTTSSSTTSSGSEFSAPADDGYAIKFQGSPSQGLSKFSHIPRITSTSNHEKRKKQFPVHSRILNAMLSPFKRSSSSLEITKQSKVKVSGEAIRNRKKSKPLTTAVNNGVFMVKKLIKFKSIPMQYSVVTSFSKLRQGVISGDNDTSQQNKSTGSNKLRLNKNYRRRFMKPFDRWTSVKPKNRQEDQSNSNRSSTSSMDKYSLDAIRRMFDAISVLKVGQSKGKQMSKLCPNSVKSSPNYRGQVLVPMEAREIYTRDNSVQAAIAHCKTSIGQI